MTAPSVSLLPCPFCNGPADFECIGAGEYTTWSVGCANSAVDCIGFQMMARFSRKCEAAEAWNTRATPPAPTPSAARELIIAAVEFLRGADGLTGLHRIGVNGKMMGAADVADALALLPDAAAIRADDVQDTYLVGGADLKAMSGDIDSNRVIKLHFRRRVTDKDHEWLLEAINLKIKSDQDATAIRAAGEK